MMESEQGMLRTPVSAENGNNDNFDAKGQPRTLRTLLNGTVARLSDEEFAEEMKAQEQEYNEHRQ